MLKKYRKTLVVTTLVLLLPILAGVLLWNKLPEQVPTHFNAAGEADGFSSRAFTVFGLPAILLGIHWLCVLGSLLMDPKAANLEGKVMNIVLWVCPLVSIMMMALVFGNALGYDLPAEVIAPLMVGVLTVIIGNWLPKCKQTWTLGIKLPWTLSDEDNWNRTHRFAAPIWVVCGLIMIAAAFIDGLRVWLMLGALIVMLVAPTVYSYHIFRSKQK